MTLRIFIRGFWLQTSIALFFFMAGILIGWLAMSSGVSPEALNNSSIKLQEFSEPLKDRVEKTVSGENENSWIYFLFGNGLANSLFISPFFLIATFKSFHETGGRPGNDNQSNLGIFPTLMFKFTGWYLRLCNLALNSSHSFLNLAMVLTFQGLVAFGFLSFCFGSFTVSAVRIIGLRFYLAAIMPHGIFEIPAALASGAMPIAMLIEIVRQKRENEDADTWQIARQLVFSRSTGIILAVIFAATLAAAIIEGHYTKLIVERLC